MNTKTSNINFLNVKTLEVVKDNFVTALIEKKKEILEFYLCEKQLFFNSKTKAETIDYLLDEKEFNFLENVFYETNDGYTFENGKGRPVLIIELIHEKKILPKLFHFLFKRSFVIQKQTFYTFEISIESGKIKYLSLSKNYFTNKQLTNLMINN